MAKGSNSIPERLVNFRVFNDNKDLLGIATVELPEISAMTDTVSGAGIAGEVDSPVLGHFGSMTCTLTWRTIEGDVLSLAKQQSHTLEVRGSQQNYDAAHGMYSTVPVRAVLRVVPKTLSLGSFEPGSATDTSNEFEVLYLKLLINGKEVCEIDKYNYICSFGGSDVLASVRADLGLN